MSDWQQARAIFCGISINDKRPIFFVVRNGYRALLTIALMPIKQYTVFRYLLQLSAKYLLKQFYKTLFFTIHAWNLQGKAQYAYTICWYKCTADPLCRQNIKVRAHKRYMQSKKNKFDMQYCKPRYLSITDKNYNRFQSKMNILSTILNWLKFCKLYCMRFLFSSPEPKAHGWAYSIGRHPSSVRRQHFQTHIHQKCQKCYKVQFLFPISISLIVW